MTTTHTWAFRASFRRRAFGWSGTRKAIERLNEAVGEIERMARTDPALAGEGAVLLLEKLSPAVSDIDSSSGALGNATAGVVETLAPLIAAAPVPRRVREKWLERLLEAIQEDDPPYIESLGEHWGALCADPSLASHWADQLLPLMQHVMADRRKGTYAYAKSGTLCYSALFHAGRFDELLAVLALDPKPYWHDQQWAAKALAARGDVDGAIDLMEGLRSRHAPDMALSAVAEQLLLDAGRVDEAYARYGIQATSANTNIATFRAIAKRYPGVEPSRVLADLIASTPGEEGKWFATAKALKQYDLALALARRAPVDPRSRPRAGGGWAGIGKLRPTLTGRGWGWVGFPAAEAVSRLPGPPLEDPPTSPPHSLTGVPWGERGGAPGACAASNAFRSAQPRSARRRQPHRSPTAATLRPT